jgi:hypothetical protein
VGKRAVGSHARIEFTGKRTARSVRSGDDDESLLEGPTLVEAVES